ncbi:hypothetical protein PA7077_01641 [Pseudomonas aeruginosa]
MSDARLAELAAAVGLQLDWQDANGRPQRVDPEVQRGLLEALGYPAQSPQQIEQSLAALARLREDSANLGLLVGECGQPLEQALGPAGTPGELVYEDGTRIALRLDAEGRLPAQARSGYAQLSLEQREWAVAMAPPSCPSLASLAPGRSRRWGSGRPGLCPAPPRRRRPGRQRRPRGPAAQRRAAWRRRAGDQPAARPGRGQRTCLQPLLAVQPAVLQCPARRAGDHSRRGGGGTGDPSRRPGRGDGPPGEPGADRLDSGGGPAHAPAAPTPPRLHRARQSLAPRPRRIPPRSRRGPAAPLPLRDPAGAPGRRPRLETLAGAAAPPRRAGGGRVLRRSRRGSGLPCLRPVADPTLPATCPAPGARGRDGHRFWSPTWRWAPMAAAARPGRGRKSCSPK